MKKKILICAVCLIALLIVALAFVTSCPLVLQKCEVPEEYLSAIYSQSVGIYVNTLPLLPVCISIESFSNQQVYYTIHYFPFGSVGMSYSLTDGINQVKPLTGLQ